MSDEPQPGDGGNDGVDGRKPKTGEPSTEFSTPARTSNGHRDGRKLFDWKSKYDLEAALEIAYEERRLLTYLGISLVLAAFSLMLSSQTLRISLPLNAVSTDGTAQPLSLTINCHVLAVFFVGWVGGTTFALKWLVHACAIGLWHLDRRPWRLIVPLLGGVYACVVLTLLDAGVFGHTPDASRPLAVSAALAFLVGYFSDGVSGLLSNVANAVFGTLEKK